MCAPEEVEVFWRHERLLEIHRSTPRRTSISRKTLVGMQRLLGRVRRHRSRGCAGRAMRPLPGVHTGRQRALGEARGGRARRALSQQRFISLSVAFGEQDGRPRGEHGDQSEEPEKTNAPRRPAWRPGGSRYAAPEESCLLGHMSTFASPTVHAHQ